jgi:hypothetical protein
MSLKRLHRASRAGIDPDGGQTDCFPFRDTAGHVSRGLALCKALPGGSQGTSAGGTREHYLAGFVRGHLRDVKGGQRVQQGTRDTLGGVFSRFADVDEQDASGIEQLFDLFGVVFGYLVRGCVRHGVR